MRLIFTIDKWMNIHGWVWVALTAISTLILAVVAYKEYKKRKIGKLLNTSNNAQGNVTQANRDIIDNSSDKYEYNSHTENVSGTSIEAHASGDINIYNNSENNLKVDDVICLVNELVKAQLETYTVQARYEAVKRNNDFNKTFGSRLDEVEDKLNRFREPSMQFALREAAFGYIKYGGEDEGEALVDLLIERVKAEDRASKQSIIDEAIKVLPKLSKECIAVLALLSYTNLVVNRTKETLDKSIRCMDPVLNLLPKVCKLDIQYLSQVNCLSPLHNCIIVRDLVKSSKKHYSMAFCHSADVEHSAEFMLKYGLRLENRALIADKTNGNAKEQIQKLITLRMIFNFNEDGTITPLLLNKDTYEEVLSQDSSMKTMIPDVQKLLSSCKVVSDQEIVSYYESFNPNWVLALRMLRDNPLNRYDLQPIGLYIGARKLFKLTGMILPMEELL